MTGKNHRPLTGQSRGKMNKEVLSKDIYMKVQLSKQDEFMKAESD